MKTKAKIHKQRFKFLRAAARYIEGDGVRATWTDEEINGARMLLLKLFAGNMNK